MATVKDQGEAKGKEEHVKEGFLCPMCMEDLCSFRNLQKHFELQHSHEDKDIMNQIKGVFARAKEKFLKRDNEEKSQSVEYYSSFQDFKSYGETEMGFWEPQHLGVIRHNMDKFRCIRDGRIDQAVVETNKITIRLEKLLLIGGTEYTKRKEYEQTLVPWVEDADVPFCPTCGNKFNVARRRHHCRLCGSIMCGTCSIFLSFGEAAELINKTNEVNQDDTLHKKLSVSLLQKFSEETNDRIYIRTCHGCNEILQRNKERLYHQLNSTLLIMLHTKMRNAMKDAERECPEFQTISDSLNKGEEEYDLGVATEKRLHLIELFEAIDVISKKILVLNLDDEENLPSPAAVRLHNAIRKAACTFLQNYMLNLPSLPSAPKLLFLQKRRRAENEKQLQVRKREAIKILTEENSIRLQTQREKHENEFSQNLERVSKDNNQTASSRVSASIFGAIGNPGWSSNAVPVTCMDDGEREYDGTMSKFGRDEKLGPLLEQIAYVGESLKQAVAAGMQTEAESLDKNLKELNIEYKKLEMAKAFHVVDASDENRETESHPSSETNFSSFPNISSGTCIESGTGNVMLQQIDYISRCIDKATVAQKYDEVEILTKNLAEIKQDYNWRG